MKNKNDDKKTDITKPSTNFRQKSEERLKAIQSKNKVIQSDIEAYKLIHELEVHQIELEMQQEELKVSNELAEAASAKYIQLYDFAPSGYLTLSSIGEILSLNFAAAKLLGNDRGNLIKKQFATFLSYHSKHILVSFIDELFQSHVTQTAELELALKDKPPVYLLLRGIADNSNSFCNMTLTDMTDRKKAEDELIYTTDQLRQLTAHLQTIREEERKRIGREIHDELGQQLTAIKMDAVWIDNKTTDKNNLIKSKLKNIIYLLDGSYQSVRKILSELRPGNLENQALSEAMEWQGRQFTESIGIPVKFTSTETSLTLSEALATCIFRVYQESLTNIMRYAQAKKVSTTFLPQGDNIILTVEDDGVGFDMVAVKNKKTFGLLGMKERVLSLNGKFDLVSSPGKGTKIVISLPYKNT